VVKWVFIKLNWLGLGVDWLSGWKYREFPWLWI